VQVLSAVLSADAALRAWLTTVHAPWLDAIMWQASAAGQAGFVWVLIAGIATLQRPALAPQLWRVVLAIVVCYVVVDALLKPSLARARPFDRTEAVRVVGHRPLTYSFPSGHTASAVAGAFVVTLMLPRARFWLWALAALIACSRVYIGVHFPLDVLGGALVGLAVGVVVTGGRAWYSQGSLTARSGAA
jgi:undecaprenyl-diphosphatase